MQESNSPKIDSDLLPTVDWPVSTMSYLFGVLLDRRLLPLHLAIPQFDHWLIVLTHLSIGVGLAFIGGCPTPIGRLLCSTIDYFSLSFLTHFPKKEVNKRQGSLTAVAHDGRPNGQLAMWCGGGPARTYSRGHDGRPCDHPRPWW
jgi:hypothetical protein